MSFNLSFALSRFPKSDFNFVGEMEVDTSFEIGRVLPSKLLLLLRLSVAVTVALPLLESGCALEGDCDWRISADLGELKDPLGGRGVRLLVHARKLFEAACRWQN